MLSSNDSMHSAQTRHPRTHLVYVQMAAVGVKLVVQTFQHVYDHERRRCAANGRKADDVAEQHCYLVMRFGLDGFSCKKKKKRSF